MKHNEFQKVIINNQTCYSFDGIITFEDFDSNNILLHKKSYENIWFMKIHENLWFVQNLCVNR